jgi:hypothetical protein
MKGVFFGVKLCLSSKNKFLILYKVDPAEICTVSGPLTLTYTIEFLNP